MSAEDIEARRRRFEEIALPLMGPLYGLALRLGGDEAAAADDVQETFLRAYRTFDNFRPGTNARAWLFTILYSVFLNRQKKTKREVRVASVEDLEERYRAIIETPVTEWPSVDAPWEEPMPREVEAALLALPEAFRSAVLFVDVHELTYAEAAEVLECPIGTVQSRVHRGRRMLFAALENYAKRAGYSPGTMS